MLIASALSGINGVVKMLFCQMPSRKIAVASEISEHQPRIASSTKAWLSGQARCGVYDPPSQFSRPVDRRGRQARNAAAIYF